MPTIVKNKIERQFRSPLIEVVRLSDTLDPATGKNLPPISKTVQIIRTGTFTHPEYGELQITKEQLASMVVNFSNKVRGIDLAVDYKHDADDIAAGWFKRVFLSDDGNALWAEIEWTPDGEKTLADKKFRYLSAEFNLDYQDNESLKKFGPTLLGAGLTNRPFIKGMEPAVPLSEKGATKMSKQKKLSEAAMSPEEMSAAIQNLQAKVEQLGGADVSVASADPEDDAEAKGDAAKVGEDNGAKESQAGDPPQEKEFEEMSYGELTKELAGHREAAKAAKAAPAADKAPAAKDAPADKAPPAKVPPAKKDEPKKLDDAAVAASEKKKKFDLMLTEGKVVEAQRAPFMSGDVVAFSEKAVVVKTARISMSDENVDTAIESAADRLDNLAKEKMKGDNNLKLADAYSMVLAEPANLELRKLYERDSING